MAMLKWILGGALAAHLGSAALLYAMQRDLLLIAHLLDHLIGAAVRADRP
jgi:hypothetical protein